MINSVNCNNCKHNHVCKYKDSIRKLCDEINQSLSCINFDIDPVIQLNTLCNLNITCKFFEENYQSITYREALKINTEPLPFDPSIIDTLPVNLSDKIECISHDSATATDSIIAEMNRCTTSKVN